MLKYRTISGILITLFLLLAGLYMPPLGIWFFFLVVTLLGQLEFYRLLNAGGIPAFRIVGLLSGAALLTATFCTTGPSPESQAAAGHWETLVLFASVMVIFLRQFPQKNNTQPLATMGCTVLGIAYVPFLMNYFMRLMFEWEGACHGSRLGLTGFMIPFYMVVVVKSTDIGAFFTGRAIGRHKLFPRISPAKTWEGFFGGIAAAVIASLVIRAVTRGSMGLVTLGWGHAVALGILLALAGIVGDLFESLLKRASGIKDSSSALPGLGGILDVIDSLLFTAPVMYYYLCFFL